MLDHADEPLFPAHKSARVGRQVSARVHGHSSSSEFNAHQMLVVCGCTWTLAFGSCLARTRTVLSRGDRGERHGVRLASSCYFVARAVLAGAVFFLAYSLTWVLPVEFRVLDSWGEHIFLGAGGLGS